jgi:flagellar basal body-associated protein FliL
MNRKTIRTILLIIIIALLLAIVAYFLLMIKPSGNTAPKTSVPPAKQAVVNNQNLNYATTTPAIVKKNVPPASSDVIAQSNLEGEARSFAERLGSYSNQSDFANIKDLKLQMTASMQTWADKYIAANEKAAYSGHYQGVTTHAISDEVKNFNAAAGQAEILVHTQKISTNATSSPVTTYQDITITFVKQNNNWLVDNAVWKK